MAAWNACTICKKIPSAYFCTGCKAYFCMKDLKTHHEQLLNEVNILCKDHNEVQAQINTVTQQNNQLNHGLIFQVNEWEMAAITKVKQTAERARQQIISILNFKRVEIGKRMDAFSKELVVVKQADDIVHDDLTRLQRMLADLYDDLRDYVYLPAVDLRTQLSDQFDWGRLIYVEENTSYSQNHQLAKQKG